MARVVAEIPLEPAQLKNVIIAVVVGFVVLSLLVARFMTKLVIKLVTIALLLGAAAVVYSQRADLSDCARKCECTFLGFDVKLPPDAKKLCQGT